MPDDLFNRILREYKVRLNDWYADQNSDSLHVAVSEIIEQVTKTVGINYGANTWEKYIPVTRYISVPMKFGALLSSTFLGVYLAPQSPFEAATWGTAMVAAGTWLSESIERRQKLVQEKLSNKFRLKQNIVDYANRADGQVGEFRELG